MLQENSETYSSKTKLLAGKKHLCCAYKVSQAASNRWNDDIIAQDKSTAALDV